MPRLRAHRVEIRMAEDVAAALSSLNMGVSAPRLNPDLVGSSSSGADPWILVTDAEGGACSVWRPSSSGSLLLPLFSSGGATFVPLASSGGLIFGRDKESKRYLVGNPLTGAWKWIPSPLSEDEENHEEDDEDEEEDVYDMCREYDREGRITEYRMLLADGEQSSKYWIIGIAENSSGTWDSWQDIDLLYEYDSKFGTWREVDMLNYGSGYDCSVSEELPKDLRNLIVLACSGLYDPERHIVHEIPDPEDASCFDKWGGAVLCAPPEERKLIIGSSLPEDEVLLWLQTGPVCKELAKCKCPRQSHSSSSSHRWYEGGDGYITLSLDDGGCLAFDLEHQAWHELDKNATLLHFSPSLTAAP